MHAGAIIGNDRKTERKRRMIFLDFDRSFLFEGWSETAGRDGDSVLASEGDSTGGGGDGRDVVIADDRGCVLPV